MPREKRLTQKRGPKVRLRCKRNWTPCDAIWRKRGESGVKSADALRAVQEGNQQREASAEEFRAKLAAATEELQQALLKGETDSARRKEVDIAKSAGRATVADGEQRA